MLLSTVHSILSLYIYIYIYMCVCVWYVWPIIFQVPTPIYELTEDISQHTTPNIPSKSSFKSSYELIQILQTLKPYNQIITSLNTGNLFSNVTVKETLDTIIHIICNKPTYSPIDINPNILGKILLSCTTEVPFYLYHSKIYKQHDGIVMGSALGSTFNNFFMGYSEKKMSAI